MRRGALALLLLVSPAAYAAAAEEVFQKAYSMEGVSRVSVENVSSSWPLRAPPGGAAPSRNPQQLSPPASPAAVALAAGNQSSCPSTVGAQLY